MLQLKVMGKCTSRFVSQFGWHIFRRNRRIKQVIEGKIGRMRRRTRRRKQLLDDLKEKKRYWNLDEEELDRTLWRTRFGRRYQPAARESTQSLRVVALRTTRGRTAPLIFNLSTR